MNAKCTVNFFVSVSLTQLVDIADQLVLPGAALQPPLLFNHEVSHHLPQCLNINGTGYDKITGYFYLRGFQNPIICSKVMAILLDRVDLSYWLSSIGDGLLPTGLPHLVNRPVVAGAVLQTPL